MRPPQTVTAVEPTTDPVRDASPDAAPGGLLLVDKPAGMTSHDVVALVRRSLRTKRVGHAGTLDPFATGLLVVLVGRGTRLIPYVDGEPKIYEATIRFGAETDTDDRTGTVTREATHVPSDVEIVEAIARLTGEIDQLPPAYSAKQVGGTRAYAAARRGAPLELQPSRVVVHEWRVLDRDGNDLCVRISCGGGTYVRALARDLGRLAGSAAHVGELRRLRSGVFSVADAVTVDSVADGQTSLRSLRDAVPSLPTRIVSGHELTRVLHGNAISADVVGVADAIGIAGDRIALVDAEQTLIAIAEREGSELRPKLVLRDV